jgi:hypothetical protein
MTTELGIAILFAVCILLLVTVAAAVMATPLAILEALAYMYWPAYRAWGIQQRAKRRVLDDLRNRDEMANEGDWFDLRVKATAKQMLTKPAFSDVMY